MKKEKKGIQLPGRVAEQLVYGYRKAGKIWADRMGNLAGRLSRRKLIVVAVVLLACANAYSGWLIFGEKDGPGIVTKRITLPGADRDRTDVPDRLKRGLEHSRRYLDSISRSPGGRSALDSLLSPGMLDSLEKIKEWNEIIK